MAGEALHDDRTGAPAAYHALFLVPAAIQWGAVLAGHAPRAVAIAATLALAVIWALFSSIRITVTDQEIRVRHGLFGPRIPVATVLRCEIAEHAFHRHGGWGVRYGRDGTVAYDMLGDREHAVRVVYRKGKKQRTVLLSARDPEQLRAAIERARGVDQFIATARSEMGAPSSDQR